MKTYDITYDDGNRQDIGRAPCPERLPQPGDVYEFTLPINTAGNCSYNIGDTLTILERTSEAPHLRLSSLGNLRVQCKYHVSVWTNIEWMIADGHLKLKPAARRSVWDRLRDDAEEL